MNEISIIAAIDEAGGIGAKNQLLAYLPADLRYFKSKTIGKPIIMGRRTYESIGRPLPERHNIVVSKSLSSEKGVTIVTSLREALLLAKESPETMVIGGAQLYAEAIYYATRLYITTIHHQFEADVFFPEIDPSIWMCTQEIIQMHDEKNLYDMTFSIYQRKALL